MFQLIYEYSLKGKFKLDTLYENAAAFLVKLQNHLNEPDPLRCITILQEKLIPAKFQNNHVKPLISFIEVCILQ